jgi:hypothetical protein
MDWQYIGALGLIAGSSGVAGYCLARTIHDRTAVTLARELGRLRLKMMGKDEDIARLRRIIASGNREVETLQRERDELLAEARARRARLSEAGRKGAILVNARKAAQHKDAAQTTIAALAVTPMRPREQVVAGVAESRRRKLQSGAAVNA